MREPVLRTEDGCEQFLVEHLEYLGRAFVASFGLERGQEALAEAMAYAWEHWTELKEMGNPVGYLYRVGQSRSRFRRRRVPSAEGGGAASIA